MRDTSFLVLLAFSIPVSFQTLAFQSPFLLSSTTTIATTRRCARQHQPKRSSALSSIFDDEKKPSDGVEFESFNPLKYNASGNSKASFSPNQIISLRKTTMQELTGRMLGSVGDGEAIQQILEEYKDFLLEPLEDLEAVLVSSKEAVLPPLMLQTRLIYPPRLFRDRTQILSILLKWTDPSDIKPIGSPWMNDLHRAKALKRERSYSR